MNDPQVNLNIPKIYWGHSRSLRVHFEVTSSLIQNAPIKLKFDINNPYVILHMLKLFERSFKVKKGS